MYDFDTVIDRHGTGSSKWSRFPADVLPMWVADMDFAAPPQVIEAIRRRLEHPVMGYAVPRAELVEFIVADLKAKYDWTILPEDLVFMPGVAAGFNMALKAMLAPGSGVVVQTPMYRPILNAPGHWGMQRVDVPLERGQGGYVTDMDALAAGLDRAGAFILCNPHNPTGKVFTRNELAAIAEMTSARDTLVISDEIHCDLLHDGRRHVPFASLSPDIARRTVTLMAASKTYNIAGLKCGFAIIPDKTIRDRMADARLGLVDSNNLIGLEATLAAYRECDDWKAEMLAYIGANRDHLAAELGRRFPGIRLVVPEGTFLAWLDCSGLGLPTDAFSWFLEEAKVGFSAGPEFGAGNSQFVRLNFGCSRAALNEGLDRMERALSRRA